VSGGITIPQLARLRRTHHCLTVVAALTLVVTIAGCGTASTTPAGDVSGTFEVAVTRATFPASQRLSEHTHMLIAVRNAGARTIPNIAATVCNVTCTYPAPPGEGTSAGAFGADISNSSAGNPSRPIWIVDHPPGPCETSCRAGGPGSGVTAYANTWALGALAPGQTKIFEWSVTAVSAGRHVVAWTLAAGLDAGMRAILADGSTPHGTFTVTVHAKPARSYVSDSGQIVNLP
jgi:hypothetical protein